MEPTALAGVQQYAREESYHSPEATWLCHGHQPRELVKRWRTLLDRRVLVIAIAQAVARSLGIASSYTFVFSYYFDSVANRLVFEYDHDQFVMRLPTPLVVEAPEDGRDLAVPAIVTAAVSGVDTLLCTFIWGGG